MGFSSPLPSRLDGPSTLVMAFGSSDLSEVGAGLHALECAFPTSVVVGCSTSGHFRDGEIHGDGLVGVVCRFERTALSVACAPISGPHSSDLVGMDLGDRLRNATPVAPCSPHASGVGPLSGVLLFSDGLFANGSAVLRGLRQKIGPIDVFGGLAGDGTDFASTWVMCPKGHGPHGVVAVGLYGDAVRLSYGSHGGWSPFGLERRVTAADGNVLYELDGRPALELYKDYLGELAAGLPATALLFPLAVRAPGSDRPLVRTILSTDNASGSMRFAGDIPEGGTAQLMRSTADHLIDGAAIAAEMCLAADTRQSDLGKGRLAFGVSCVGRRLVLGHRSDEELEAVSDVLGVSSTLVGFYSYGEITPSYGASELHNQTMTLTVIDEICA